MTSDKAKKLPHQSAELVRQTIDAEVRRHRPNLTTGHYQFVAGEVFRLICDDIDDALLQQAPDEWTPNLLDAYVSQRVNTYLTKLEINIGRMVLYERTDDDNWC